MLYESILKSAIDVCVPLIADIGIPPSVSPTPSIPTVIVHVIEPGFVIVSVSLVE